MLTYKYPSAKSRQCQRVHYMKFHPPEIIFCTSIKYYKQELMKEVTNKILKHFQNKITNTPILSSNNQDDSQERQRQQKELENKLHREHKNL